MAPSEDKPADKLNYQQTKDPTEQKASAVSHKQNLVGAKGKIILAIFIVLCGLVYFSRNLILGTQVDAYAASTGNLRQSVVASGRIIWPQRISVASEIIGRVSAIPVIEGQQVSRDQLLIQLEDKDELASLAALAAATNLAQSKLRQQRELTLPAAEENLIQAQINVLQTGKQHVRMQQLIGEHFISAEELETAAHNLNLARSHLATAELTLTSNQKNGSETAQVLFALEQSKANVQLAKIKLAQDSLRAPAAGTLISRSVEVGDMVQPGKVLMVLAAQGETQLEVQIDEKNLAKIALGQVALGSADAFSERRFSAEVSYINPGIDPLRGSIEIKLRVPNPPEYLRQDMTVSVDIETAKRTNALIIPTAALRDASGERPWVLVVRNHYTVHQDVKIGLRGDDSIEILSGIRAGEGLILPSLGLIKADQHVRVKWVKTL